MDADIFAHADECAQGMHRFLQLHGVIGAFYDVVQWSGERKVKSERFCLAALRQKDPKLAVFAACDESVDGSRIMLDQNSDSELVFITHFGVAKKIVGGDRVTFSELKVAGLSPQSTPTHPEITWP